MTKPRRARAARADSVSDAAWRFLFDAPMPGGESPYWDVYFETAAGGPDIPELWERYGGDVLRAWAVERPGTRPALWWQFSAPEPQRRRLGGVGTPASDCLAYMPRLRLGIPADWLMPETAAYYRREDRRFRWPPVSADDPPRYESQATFLKRHGLVTTAEKARLSAEDFEPESVAVA